MNSPVVRPQLTLKALVLGAVLAMVLAGANAYLGLFAGMTVSASIPAAVISMGLLKLFRDSNILENNIVQTAASAGESVAAGVIFTLPALILLGYWDVFDYWWVSAIAGLGGLLGVLFTIPLRRSLVVDQPLPFPEGTATAEVLKLGEQAGSGLGTLASAALLGAGIKFAETGARLWPATAQTGTVANGSTVWYFGSNLSPALVGVVFGTWGATRIGDVAFERVLGVVLLLAAVLILWKPLRIMEDTQVPPPPAGAKRWWLIVAFFGLGIYSGFIQAGVGFLFVALFASQGIDLIRANGIKAPLILMFTGLAIALFAFTGLLNWVAGLTLAGGQFFGAKFGVRLQVLKGQRWVRSVLILAIVAFSIRLLLGG